MKLIDELKATNSKGEAKKVIEGTGMELTDEESDLVVGGTNGIGGNYRRWAKKDAAIYSKNYLYSLDALFDIRDGCTHGDLGSLIMGDHVSITGRQTICHECVFAEIASPMRGWVNVQALTDVEPAWIPYG